MKKVAIIGSGERSLNAFGGPIVQNFGESLQLVAICDKNIKRADTYLSKAKAAKHYSEVRLFSDADKMLSEMNPDIVIVATIDSTHHEYIIKAMQSGCHVISEKPLTTDIAKCSEIFQTKLTTGKDVTVTFNCRFMPYMVKIKELLMSGIIGKVLNVNYEYLLDKQHGSSYFRRWHRNMCNSGGMLVHKSTHHFDLVNWWLDDEPETVSAQGKLIYYGPNRPYSDKRCSTCPHTDKCEYYWDITTSGFYKDMYYDHEKVDNYIRDNCVFAPDIDIYDTMAVNVGYKSGALLSYTLSMYHPYEGFKLTFTGTEGRLEAMQYFDGITEEEETIRIYKGKGQVDILKMDKANGAHAGGDDRMRSMLFSQKSQPDPLHQMSSLYDGAKAMLIGACANQSIIQRKNISVAAELSKLIK